MDEDRLALEQFLVENPQLERLEALLGEFNIFEALGAVNVELRHSEFLAFLLSPNQSHGLGALFARRFLQKAIAGADPARLPFNAIDLDIWDLDDLEVRREWQGIDIFLFSAAHQLAIIIENKIGSGEHSQQLQRYYQSVTQHFRGARILGLYLTAGGDEPSDDRYLPVSYESVCSLLKNLYESRRSTLGPEVRTLMLHYTAVLRRYILSGSEIESLCREIYRKHRRALDVLFEYRPDQQAEIHDFLTDLIKQTPQAIPDFTTKIYIRFATQALDAPLLQQGQGWNSSGRIMLFEFKNLEDRVSLYLLIGPGPHETRQKMFQLAQRHQPPFRPSQSILGKSYQTIYKLDFLSARDYENASSDVLEEKIKKQWDKFLTHDLPLIETVLKQQPWLWPSDSPAAETGT